MTGYGTAHAQNQIGASDFRRIFFYIYFVVRTFWCTVVAGVGDGATPPPHHQHQPTVLIAGRCLCWRVHVCLCGYARDACMRISSNATSPSTLPNRPRPSMSSWEKNGRPASPSSMLVRFGFRNLKHDRNCGCELQSWSRPRECANFFSATVDRISLPALDETRGRVLTFDY